MATLKMKQEYKDILEKYGALDAYIYALKICIDHYNESSKERLFEILESKTSFISFLKSSFTWANSPQGFDYWNQIS